jgi:RNA polymerase sigma-70 factor, ECF subfamily
VEKRTDMELVARARSGDKRAFDQLVARYQPLAQRVARGMVAESARDLAQEAMLQAYLSLGHLQDDSRFQSWLHGIVRNVCRSYLRDLKANWLSLETLAGGMMGDGIPLSGSVRYPPLKLGGLSLTDSRSRSTGTAVETVGALTGAPVPRYSAPRSSRR